CRGLEAGYRWPQFSIHRGELQRLLLRAVRDRLGDQNLLTGLKLTGFEQDGNRVNVLFADSQTGSDQIVQADVLVGADGIHSAVRNQLFPTEGAPRFAKQMLWRAAVEAEPFLGGQTMVIAGHFHQRIIVYPIARRRNGKTLINWICQKTVSDQAPPREDWN